MGLARGAAIVSAQEGFAATYGVLEIAEGLFTGPRQVPDGVIFHLGDRDRGAISRASEAGQWQGRFRLGADPQRADYASFADITDPDGNTWTLQERGHSNV